VTGIRRYRKDALSAACLPVFAAIPCGLIDDAQQWLPVLISGECFKDVGIQCIGRADCAALTERIDLGRCQCLPGQKIPVGGIAELSRMAAREKALDIGGTLIGEQPCAHRAGVQGNTTEQSENDFGHDRFCAKKGALVWWQLDSCRR